METDERNFDMMNSPGSGKSRTLTQRFLAAPLMVQRIPKNNGTGAAIFRLASGSLLACLEGFDLVSSP
ncbi:MAG: hypothetical protein R3F37_22945 [Candidatus Competibacteraceae bacterium]